MESNSILRDTSMRGAVCQGVSQVHHGFAKVKSTVISSETRNSAHLKRTRGRSKAIAEQFGNWIDPFASILCACVDAGGDAVRFARREKHFAPVDAFRRMPESRAYRATPNHRPST